MSTEDEKLINHIKDIPLEQIRSLPYFNNRGILFMERALIQDAQGERELAFSNVFKEYVEQHGWFELYDLDLKTACTMFQWLTTNVGESVLEEALRATGRRIKYD